MHLRDAKKLIKALFKRQIDTGQRFSVEIVSGPGLGKSECMEQVCKELSKDMGETVGYSPFFLSTLEQPDVRGFGLPATDADGSSIMKYTAAPWMPRAGSPKHGIVFLDEFRQAGHDVQKPAAELLLNGRVGESQLPDTWMVVAASNRESDRSGVQRELAFISNRRMEIKIQPDLASWVDWAERRGDVHWAAIAFAKTQPGLIFGDKVPDKPGPFATPRSFVKMSYLIGEMKMEMFTEAAMGLVGEGVGAAFVSFLRVVEQLPEFDEIVANPLKCRLPEKDRPDAQYATMQMIAHRVDDTNAAAAFSYLKRMDREFQVAGLKATLKRCPAVLRSKDFAGWVKDNKDLLVNTNLLNAS
ncbi:hypothetical protein MNBD_GAMMA15-1661 [hydrothermal vent metagenome]|uniref:ATPase dynein-related AAA domain-containing protein n=1 Tax=hydrothermal vent metagenome TaxID=652676 RepID=A0A3B0YSH1_9ZZZZ